MNKKAGCHAVRPIPLKRFPECTILVASDWAPIRAFDPIIKSDPESVYGDLLPLLRSADLRIVNCECALTASRKPVWKSGTTFKGEPRHVRGLIVVPFDIACLANNHVFDYGLRGFRESLNILHRNGIRTAGAGLTEEQAYAPLALSCNGNRISLINISEGEDLTAARGGPGVCGWDPTATLAAIHQRKQNGDFVMVIAHCGLEYIPYPPPYVAAAFRAMVDAGADCVIGHHPHVPQGIEWYQGRPIAYSLGNFVFYQHTDLYYRRVGFCIRLKLAGNTLASLEMLPYRITETGLRRLGPAEETSFQRKIAQISKPLHARAGAAKAWEAYLAYYGMSGFTGEVLGIVERMKTEPQKGAAMFRNRITTLQHAELWRDFLTRVMDKEPRPYSKKAIRVIREWFTKTTKHTQTGQ
jgi:poly-gamma-glutamate capsule biosynthesis protein CapA/YwtB (metallophosphatase superfamily)